MCKRVTKFLLAKIPESFLHSSPYLSLDRSRVGLTTFQIIGSICVKHSFALENRGRRMPRARRSGGIWLGRHTLRGITTGLRQLYFASWSYPSSSGASTSVRASGTWGLERGRNADTAVAILASEQHAAIRQLARRQPHAYRDAICAMHTLRHLRLRLSGTQVVCGIPSLGIGTYVDMKCTDLQTYETILVEQKTGYHHTSWLHATGQMAHELRAFSNCPLNQACLQLAVSCYLFEQTYRQRVARAYVIRIYDSGTSYHLLPDEMRRHAPIIVHRLAQHYRASR